MNKKNLMSQLNPSIKHATGKLKMNQTATAINITMRGGVNPIGIIATTAIGSILAILACTDTALAACISGSCSFPQNGVSFDFVSYNPTAFNLYNIRDLYNQTGLTDFEVVLIDNINGTTTTIEYPGANNLPDPNLTTLFSYNGNFSSNSTGFYGVPIKNQNQSIHDAYFTKDGVKSVPEPLTLFGSMTALGGGVVFKRKLTKKNKEDSSRV